MILTRLYELARRPGETILDDPAFEAAPVPYVVQVGPDGEYLGVQERRGVVETPSKKKGAPPKTQPDKGVLLRVPRPHGNTATQGFARYFADTLARVLPVADDDKSGRSRATFWAQIERAGAATDDPALKAAAAFGRRLADDAELAARVKADVEAREPDAGDRCTLAWEPDGGPTVVERQRVREWYSAFLGGVSAGRQDAGPVGVCQITGEVGPLPTSHPLKLSGVPGGMSVGVSLISFDKPAFESYGLDAAANAGVGYAATDAYSRALVALIQGTVKGNRRTGLRVGGTLFLFWTREPADTGWMAMFDAPDTDAVRAEFASVAAGGQSHLGTEENQFYLLALSGNAARAVVRDYLERRLGAVKAAAARWFADLRIADPAKEFQGRPNDRFPLWMLAVATALESDRVAPDIHTRLLHAALTGGPLPDSVLAGCLGRLRAEGSDGFRAARMGLIKLCLLRRDRPVSESLDPSSAHPAYVYGRLLRLFEEVQYAALGDVNASVVDKFYGTFSAAPALVFARLFANARNHLRKLRGDNEAAFVALDRQLMKVCGLLPAVPPAGVLSLADQGRFALGYYHQKAQTAADIAERRAAKAAKAADAATA